MYPKNLAGQIDLVGLVDLAGHLFPKNPAGLVVQLPKYLADHYLVELVALVVDSMNLVDHCLVELVALVVDSMNLVDHRPMKHLAVHLYQLFPEFPNFLGLLGHLVVVMYPTIHPVVY